MTWLYLPADASSATPVPVIVMAHGLGAVKAQAPVGACEHGGGSSGGWLQHGHGAVGEASQTNVFGMSASSAFCQPDWPDLEPSTKVRSGVPSEMRSSTTVSGVTT